MRRLMIIGCLLLLPALGAWVKRPGTGVTKTEAVKLNAEKDVLGMWSRFQPEKEGDPQRFYYFHKGGIGLFRYGRMGLTYTQTFRYEVDAKRLRLTFNKTGERVEVPYKIEGAVLTLDKDPRMGGVQSYTKRAMASRLDAQAFKHPLARLWIEPTGDKKQGGFRMYQLQAPTIDGRGVGWYHEGDYADWSTETLQYRRTGKRLSLFFPVRNEQHVSDLVEGHADGVRTLRLVEDPRNFWHPRTYKDGGPGFTMMIDHAPLPYYVPGHGVRRGCKHAH